MMFGLVAAGLVAKEAMLEDDVLKRRVDLVAFIVGAALCSGYVLAVLLPIMSMHDSLGGG